MTPTKLLSFVTDEKDVVLDGTKLQIVISNDANDHQLNSLWCHVHCHRPCVVAALLSNALVALSIGDFQEPSEAPILMKYCTPSVAKHLQCSTSASSTTVNCSCPEISRSELQSFSTLAHNRFSSLLSSTATRSVGWTAVVLHWRISSAYNFSPLLHSTGSLAALHCNSVDCCSTSPRSHSYCCSCSPEHTTSLHRCTRPGLSPLSALHGNASQGKGQWLPALEDCQIIAPLGWPLSK